MPTNSNYDRYFTGFGNVPMFTYGMISITAVVLAYMTYMDEGIPEEATESILEATSMDGVIESNPMDTIPEEESQKEESQTEEPQTEELQQEALQQEEEQQQTPPEAELIQQELPEAEPIQEAQVIQQERISPQEKAIVGGKRKKRSTRRSRPSEKKH